MANINNIPTGAFFQIDVSTCEALQEKSYHKEGTHIQLPVGDACPIIKKTFQELREAHFREKAFPYAVIYIQCKNNSTFCDGQAAMRWLEKGFIHPQTLETAEKVYLFAQGFLQQEFQFIESCNEKISPSMKEATLAFCREASQEVRECRNAFLNRPKVVLHGRELEPLFQQRFQDDPNNISANLALAKIYCVGTTSIPKNFDKARSLFTRALQRDPGAAQTLHRVAENYLYGENAAPKDPQQACEFLELALQYNPTHIDCLDTLAILYRYGGEKFAPNLQKAAALFERILKIDPNHLRALFTLGTMLGCKEPGIECDFPRAEKLLEAAHKLSPKKDSIPASLGQLYFFGGQGFNPDLQKSAAYCEEALKINPKNEYAPRLLGQILLDGCPNVPQDIPRGVKLLEDALTIDPKELIITIKLAKVYQSGKGAIQPNRPHAITLWENACALRSSSIENLRQNGFPDAIQLFRQALQLNPQDSRARDILGTLLLDPSKGNPADEIEGVKLLESVQPSTQTALEKLGDFFERGGKQIPKNWKKAKDYFEQALAINPDAKHSLFFLSKILYTGSQDVPKNWAPVETHLNHLLQLAPTSPPVRGVLGEIYRIGKFGVVQNCKKAKEHLEAALKINPEYAFALTNLGLLLYSGGDGVAQDKEQGRALLEKAVKIAPQDQYAQHMLASIDSEHIAESFLHADCSRFRAPAPSLLEGLLQLNAKPPAPQTHNIELPNLNNLQLNSNDEKKG